MNILKMNYTDVAETKRNAEAGDKAAQLSLGDTFASQNRPSEALEWYRKAAHQGSLEAVYRIGKTLLGGAPGVPTEKSVAANPATGIQFVFWAATNRYTAAYYDMYTANRDGTWVAKDIIQAYAWLQLSADTSAFPIGSTRQAELNRLALDLDVSTSQAGKRLAELFKAGHWPTLTVTSPAQASPKSNRPQTIREALQRSVSSPAPAADLGLKFNGIAYGKNPLAIINGKGMAEGESVTLALTPKPVTLKCIKIETNSVLISLDGEGTPRRLFRN
jgi:hypothetical protein